MDNQELERLDELIEQQLGIMREVISNLPERDFHKTLIGDPSIGAAIFALSAVQEALRGNDFYLRRLAELTPPCL